MKELAFLAKWIQPQHLQQDAITGYRQGIVRKLEDGLVLDNFLQPGLLEKIDAFVVDQARFETIYALRHKPRPKLRVSEEEWLQASEKKRFWIFDECVGVKPDYAMSVNWLTYLTFFHGCIQNGLSDFVKALTGQSLECKVALLQSHRKGHFLKVHTDDATDWKFCCVLYLTPDWRPEFGENFVMIDRNRKKIVSDYVPNRFLLFEPQSDLYHYVSPRTELAGDRRRSRLVAWFGNKLCQQINE